MNYQITFIEQLQHQYAFQLIHQSEHAFDQLAEIYQDVRVRLIRKAFQQLLHASERDDKNIEKIRRASESKEDPFASKMMAISVINEEDWKEKLTPEEL
jgi:hypothetical protein